MLNGIDNSNFKWKSRNSNFFFEDDKGTEFSLKSFVKGEGVVYPVIFDKPVSSPFIRLGALTPKKAQVRFNIVVFCDRDTPFPRDRLLVSSDLVGCIFMIHPQHRNIDAILNDANKVWRHGAIEFGYDHSNLETPVGEDLPPAYIERTSQGVFRIYLHKSDFPDTRDIERYNRSPDPSVINVYFYPPAETSFRAMTAPCLNANNANTYLPTIISPEIILRLCFVSREAGISIYDIYYPDSLDIIIPPLPYEWGSILAHEIGHFFGLSHLDVEHTEGISPLLVSAPAGVNIVSGIPGISVDILPIQILVLRSNPFFEPDCNDKFDNDKDGRIDLADSRCSSPDDNREDI